MKYRFFFILIFGVTLANGQEHIPFIDYEIIFPSVTESAGKQDYEAVIEQLNLINKNDSTYCSVLTSKSYYYLLQEKYDEALAITNEGLSLDCGSQSKLYYLMNKGVSYTGKKDYEKALEVYETALEQYPRNPKLWLNKGMALEKLDDTSGAIEAIQKAIIYNPMYRNAHLELGNICYRQNLMAQALMCYNMSLIVEPDSERAFALLKYVNEIVADKNNSASVPNLEVSPDDAAFKTLDLILTNRVALNDN